MSIDEVLAQMQEAANGSTAQNRNDIMVSFATFKDWQRSLGFALEEMERLRKTSQAALQKRSELNTATLDYIRADETMRKLHEEQMEAYNLRTRAEAEIRRLMA